MKPEKFIIVISPCILFLCLFSIYWLLYVVPYNNSQKPGLGIPYSYWNVTFVIFGILMFLRIINYTALDKNQNITAYFKTSILIYNFICVFLIVGLLGNIGFFIRIFHYFKENVIMHMLLLLLSSLFTIKFIMNKNAR